MWEIADLKADNLGIKIEARIGHVMFVPYSNGIKIKVELGDGPVFPVFDWVTNIIICKTQVAKDWLGGKIDAVTMNRLIDTV